MGLGTQARRGRHRRTPDPPIPYRHLGALLAGCAALILAAGGITAWTLTPTPPPMVTADAVPAVPSGDPTKTPAAQRYLAALAGQGIGSSVLAPDEALLLGSAVCREHGQEGLALLAQQIRELLPRKLTPIESATLVDVADKQLCSG